MNKKFMEDLFKLAKTTTIFLHLYGRSLKLAKTTATFVYNSSQYVHNHYYGHQAGS